MGGNGSEILMRWGYRMRRYRESWRRCNVRKPLSPLKYSNVWKRYVPASHYCDSSLVLIFTSNTHYSPTSPSAPFYYNTIPPSQLGKNSLADPAPAAARILRDVLREHLDMRTQTIEQNSLVSADEDP